MHILSTSENVNISQVNLEQGRRNHLKLGGRGTTLRGHFFLKNKKDTSLFTAKFWEAPAPSVPPPVPASMI